MVKIFGTLISLLFVSPVFASVLIPAHHINPDNFIIKLAVEKMKSEKNGVELEEYSIDYEFLSEKSMHDLFNNYNFNLEKVGLRKKPEFPLIGQIKRHYNYTILTKDLNEIESTLAFSNKNQLLLMTEGYKKNLRYFDLFIARSVLDKAQVELVVVDEDFVNFRGLKESIYTGNSNHLRIQDKESKAYLGRVCVSCPVAIINKVKKELEAKLASISGPRVEINFFNSSDSKRRGSRAEEIFYQPKDTSVFDPRKIYAKLISRDTRLLKGSKDNYLPRGLGIFQGISEESGKGEDIGQEFIYLYEFDQYAYSKTFTTNYTDPRISRLPYTLSEQSKKDYQNSASIELVLAQFVRVKEAALEAGKMMEMDLYIDEKTGDFKQSIYFQHDQANIFRVSSLDVDEAAVVSYKSEDKESIERAELAVVKKLLGKYSREELDYRFPETKTMEEKPRLLFFIEAYKAGKGRLPRGMTHKQYKIREALNILAREVYSIPETPITKKLVRYNDLSEEERAELDKVITEQADIFDMDGFAEDDSVF